MAEIVGMGVVGAGAIGLRGALSHLTLPDVQDRVRVVAVCDPAPGRAEAADQKYGVPAAYRSYEESTDSRGHSAALAPSGFVECEDVLDWRYRLQVVAWSDDKTRAVRSQRLDQAGDFSPDVIRRTEGERLLVVDRAMEA